MTPRTFLLLWATLLSLLLVLWFEKNYEKLVCRQRGGAWTELGTRWELIAGVREYYVVHACIGGSHVGA